MDKEKFRELSKQITGIANEIEALLDKYEIHQNVALEVGDDGYVSMHTSDYKMQLIRVDGESDYYIETREKL